MTGIFLSWFFLKAPREILRLGQNFLLWGWQFFSIGYFVPRLFSAWHRDLSSYGRGFDLERFLQIWGWNLISRFIGAVMRLTVMAAGLLVESVIAAVTAFTFMVWYLLPFLSVALVALGFVTIFVV